MKPFAPALSLWFVVCLVVACKAREDVDVAAVKYADAFCTKAFECNVPFENPDETLDTCKVRLEQTFIDSADGATRTECSKEENDACRGAIRAQECTDFVLETILKSNPPAACRDC
jgi:hypothetical protein